MKIYIIVIIRIRYNNLIFQIFKFLPSFSKTLFQYEINLDKTWKH